MISITLRRPLEFLSGSQKAYTMGRRRLRTCPRHPRLLKITCNIHMVKKLLDFTCSLNRHNISTRACQGCQIFLILYTSPSRKLNHLGFGSSTANPLPLTLYLYTNLHSFCRPQLLTQELINPPNSYDDIGSRGYDLPSTRYTLSSGYFRA